MAHQHNVYDTDKHFKIDPITREIINQTPEKIQLVQGDHNSERFTFEIAKVDGHAMSQCNKVEVHFLNVAADKTGQHADVYVVDDMQESPDSSGVVIFSWLISGNATQYAGTLSFIVRFSCLTGETVDYVWNSGIYKGISIAEGMNNGEAVVSEYTDVLEGWKREILSDFSFATTARVSSVTILANKWVGDASPYSQIVTVEGVPENSKVDLAPSVEQLAAFHNKDLAFVTENDGGVVTVYAIGQKPENDYPIQATITEVTI